MHVQPPGAEVQTNPLALRDLRTAWVQAFMVLETRGLTPEAPPLSAPSCSNPHGTNPLNPRGCARAGVQLPQPQGVCLKLGDRWLNPHGANPLRHSGVQRYRYALRSEVRVGRSAVVGAQTAGVFARGGDTHL